MKMTYASALLVAVLGISGSANAGDRYRSQSNNSQENLRYGLIGNGTGMGTEDTTSKGMTDNNTLADPKAGNHALGIVQSGALSAPVEYGTTAEGHRHSRQSLNGLGNLRYGLIGNGTGMGTEDATSKGMTDNNTLADPKADKQADGIAETGAPSEPVQSGSTGGSY